MLTFLATFAVFVLVIFGMSLGWIIKRKSDQYKDREGCQKRQHHQPPKSSSRMFSSSTPRSLSILITAAFITGGPHI